MLSTLSQALFYSLLCGPRSVWDKRQEKVERALKTEFTCYCYLGQISTLCAMISQDTASLLCSCLYEMLEFPCKGFQSSIEAQSQVVNRRRLVNAPPCLKSFIRIRKTLLIPERKGFQLMAILKLCQHSGL